MQPGVVSQLERVSHDMPDFAFRGAVYETIRRRVSKAAPEGKTKPDEKKETQPKHVPLDTTDLGDQNEIIFDSTHWHVPDAPAIREIKHDEEQE